MNNAWIVLMILVLLGLGQWRMYSSRKHDFYEKENERDGS